MSSKEDLSASVPILVGPNWIIWEAQMKAYLRTKGLWQLVSGNEIRPTDLAVERNAQIQSNQHPAADMNTMWDLFKHLCAQHVDIPTNLRALILLNAIPPAIAARFLYQLC